MTALAMLAEAASSVPEKGDFNQGFTLQGLVLFLTIVSLFGGLLLNSRKIRRENEADIRAADQRVLDQVTQPLAALAERQTKAETRILDSMPKTEILAAIEHEKNNRRTACDALDLKVDRGGRDIIELRVAFGKLEQKQDTLASDVGEIKVMVKEQGRDTAARFDKLQDCLTSISRKVGP